MLQVEGLLRLRRILASVRALAAASGVPPDAAAGPPDASPLARVQHQLAAVVACADGLAAAGGPHPMTDPGPTLDLNAIPPPFARPAAPPAVHAGSGTAALVGSAEGPAAGAAPGERAEAPGAHGTAQPTAMPVVHALRGQPAPPSAMLVDNEQDDDEEVCSDRGCPCCRVSATNSASRCSLGCARLGCARSLQRFLPHWVRMQAGCRLCAGCLHRLGGPCRRLFACAGHCVHTRARLGHGIGASRVGPGGHGHGPISTSGLCRCSAP